MPEVVFQGDRILIKTLRRLPTELERVAYRKSLRKAARVFIRGARALVPRQTGILRKSLGVRVKFYRSTGVWSAVVGPRVKFESRYKGVVRRPFRYAHLVELGTRPHKQRFVKVLSLRFAGDIHPGTRPKPFLGPTFDREQRKAFDVLNATISDQIDKFARRTAVT